MPPLTLQVADDLNKHEFPIGNEEFNKLVLTELAELAKKGKETGSYYSQKQDETEMGYHLQLYQEACVRVKSTLRATEAQRRDIRFDEQEITMLNCSAFTPCRRNNNGNEYTDTHYFEEGTPFDNRTEERRYNHSFRNIRGRDETILNDNYTRETNPLN